MMSPDDFNALVSAYGSEPARWPDGVRASALEYMAAQQAEADRAIRAEFELDMAIAQSRLSPGTDLLEARIINTIADYAAPRVADGQPSRQAAAGKSNRRRSYGLAAAMLAVLIAGFGYGGLVLDNITTQKDPSSPVRTAQMAASDVDLSLTESQLWEDAALDYGVADIYEWIEADDAGDSVPLYEY